MSKATKISQLDGHMINRLEHDEDNDAKRVFIVGGEKIDIQIDTDKIAEAIRRGIMEMAIGINTISKEDNTRIVEKQVFIPQIEYREIEKPIIVEKTNYQEIRTNTNIVPLWVKLTIAGQFIFILGILSYLLK